MKVFCLLERIAYEGDTLLEVFSSEENLINYIKKSYKSESEDTPVYKTDNYGDTVFCCHDHKYGCSCCNKFVMVVKELQ